MEQIKEFIAEAIRPSASMDIYDSACHCGLESPGCQKRTE